jgi:hypothetical protein
MARTTKNSYVGGSNLVSEDDFKDYIKGKEVSGFRFGRCDYTRTENAERAENALLLHATKWNKQRESNLDPKKGFVYILRA